MSRLETPYRVLTLAHSGRQKAVLSDGNIVLTCPFTTEDQGISAFLLAQTKGRDFLALGMEGLRLLPVTLYNDTRLTVVFPDRTAYRAIADFFGPFGPKLRFVAQDPRVFLAQTRERFDGVLVGRRRTLAAGCKPPVLRPGIPTCQTGIAQKRYPGGAREDTGELRGPRVQRIRKGDPYQPAHGF